MLVTGRQVWSESSLLNDWIQNEDEGRKPFMARQMSCLTEEHSANSASSTDDKDGRPGTSVSYTQPGKQFKVNKNTF